MITRFKIFENKIWGKFDYKYKFDKSRLQPIIDNARKYSKQDFIETYVEYNNITIYNGKSYPTSIKKGDEIELARLVIDDNGKRVYIDSEQVYSPYKKVIAEKDYNQNHWEFILNHTKELQEEAARLYDENKNKAKPKFKKSDKTIRGFHASPYKFKNFKYLGKGQSGQVGAGNGFFFFKDIKYAQRYAATFDKGYIYECDIKIGNTITDKGENIGTNWGRAGWLEQMRTEGYDTVIIEDADTGYGITDEIVVFDDDNINIIKIYNV